MDQWLIKVKNKAYGGTMADFNGDCGGKVILGGWGVVLMMEKNRVLWLPSEKGRVFYILPSFKKE